MRDVKIWLWLILLLFHAALLYTSGVCMMHNEITCEGSFVTMWTNLSLDNIRFVIEVDFITSRISRISSTCRQKSQRSTVLYKKPHIINVDLNISNTTFMNIKSKLEKKYIMKSVFLFVFSESNIAFKIYVSAFDIFVCHFKQRFEIGLTEQYYLRRASILSYIRSVSRNGAI